MQAVGFVVLSLLVVVALVVDMTADAFVMPRPLIRNLQTHGVSESGSNFQRSQMRVAEYVENDMDTRTRTVLNALQMSPSGSSSTGRCSEIEFDLHVGKALDTLRKDYKELLERPPDYSLYCKDMELVDPSGVTVHGIRSYQNAYRLLHAILKFFYCPEKSSMTSVRMYFDPVKRCIRISWNAEIVPREIFGGTRSILHVDVISVYEFDRGSGKIVRHRLEHLIMNNEAIKPKEGLVAALQEYHGVSVPNFCQTDEQLKEELFNVPFVFSTKSDGESVFYPAINSKISTQSLNSMEAARSHGDDTDKVNWEAFERKNKSRKKFGLSPLTVEEFLNVESRVKAMDAEQEVKRQQQLAASEAARAQEQQQKNQKTRLLDRFLGNVLKDTCESNFDCVRPEVCCDFGFKKVCCSSGSPVLGQPAVVPVPVETADYPGQPPSRY